MPIFHISVRALCIDKYQPWRTLHFPQGEERGIIVGAEMKLLLVLVVVPIMLPLMARCQLRTDFYERTCTSLNNIVRAVVRKAIISEPRMAASLLRLHFHDCMVNGCDASILLDDNGTFVGEKTAGPNNNSARGFNVIDDAKSAVESACPLTVSCADILALAARESVYLTGGPFWWVPLGRRDSIDANRTAANVRIPAPNDPIQTLISKFRVVGLPSSDVITLSGAHTIGRARCVTFSSRLFDFNNTGTADPTIESDVLSNLQMTCPQGGDGDRVAALDRNSMDAFDNHYYKNLLDDSGLLESDQILYSGQDVSAELKSLVENYAKNQYLFFAQFSDAMIRMANILPLTGSEGQIRKNCRLINDS